MSVEFGSFPVDLLKPTNFLNSVESDRQLMRDKFEFTFAATQAVDAAEKSIIQSNGEKFNEIEKKWLYNLSVSCFRLSALVEREGSYDLGKLAFAYGLAETVAAHTQGLSITELPTQESVEKLDGVMLNVFNTIAPAVGKFLAPEDNVDFVKSVLILTHATRIGMLSNPPPDSPLSKAYAHHGKNVLVAPLYTLAKTQTYGKSNEKVGKMGIGHEELGGDIVLQELETAVFNLIHGEGPPEDVGLGDLYERQTWSRLAVVAKDLFLLDVNTISPAFVFGNYVIGEMTGNYDYGSRMAAGARASIRDFFERAPIDSAYILDESVPKSVWGAFDKVFRDDGELSLSTKMQVLYKEYFGREYPRIHQFQSPYYYINMREKLNMFAELIRAYFTDGVKDRKIEDFLQDVVYRMKQDVYDLHRVRAYIGEKPIGSDVDFDEEKKGKQFDALCKRVLQEDEDAFIIFDGRVNGKGEFKKISLREIVNSRSVYATLADWYERHLYPEPGDYVERVFAAVVTTRKFSGEKVAGELQLIPLKYAIFAWQSRQNFKMYREGEDPYTSYQRKN